MGESSPRLVAKILQGDALTELTFLESESIDCCITSPPYWALRDYKVDGQLGLEPTFQEYITKLVSIFDEVKRVLNKTGTCWVVIGDTYARDGTKSLCMIPERFAISMIDHGWILRNKIIWYKPNGMPSSAKDRFTVDWEYVYFFTKSQKYFFETQYEPLNTIGSWSTNNKSGSPYDYDNPPENKPHSNNPRLRTVNSLGRIKRCVWKISTKPFSGAHFAVFPPDLVLPMIRAGCPEFICDKCGTPRKLEYEETRVNTRPGLDVGNMKSGTELDPNQSLHTSELSKYRQQIVRMPKFDSRHFRSDGTYYKIGGNKYTEAGLASGNPNTPKIRMPKFGGNPMMTDCGCNAGFHSGVVLDPFFGAGTVGLVALQNGRDFVGIELNPDYIEIANKRLDPLLNQQKLR